MVEIHELDQSKSLEDLPIDGRDSFGNYQFVELTVADRIETHSL